MATTLTWLDCCKILFAIILPPIAVLLDRGCGPQLVLNIILTLCGWLPVILQKESQTATPQTNAPGQSSATQPAVTIGEKPATATPAGADNKPLIHLRMPVACKDCLKVVFAVILPPVAVMMERGCGTVWCISFILTILFFVPVGEEVDSELEAKLEGLQSETDELLVKIAALRRTCPDNIRERFFMQLEDLERAMPGVKETLAPMEVNLEMNELALEGLIQQLEKLKGLNQLVAKLRRARTVLTETSTLEESKAPAEDLSDMLSRQRRITRQHDLASKLLAQQ
ncbi:Stress response RCI peptide [Paramicrosporidium saccamoebae]|uniref:Stress response RCI peptide n=1 Tax=Paramicrosporidium saccamoebae TaxID=1246581 RepID=A0A2H9TQ63_9FUNG|nr:Stress response RCI peptide [Paramicrosporidium saccamoebae]